MKLKTVIDREKTVEFDITIVASVYIGKPKTCMCGCAGVYYYNSLNAVNAGKDRGYEIEQSEINDEMVRKVLRKFLNTNKKIENIDDYIFTIEYETKQYTIYLEEKQLNQRYPSDAFPSQTDGMVL